MYSIKKAQFSARSDASAHMHYHTRGGIRVQRTVAQVCYKTSIDTLRDRLDEERGVLLSSTFEFPGRYNRWDIGFVNPPIALTARDRHLTIEALNKRGEIMLPEIERALRGVAEIHSIAVTKKQLSLFVQECTEEVPEEQRSRKASVFTVIRALTNHFFSKEDSRLGLYGAFAYDLAFQFEAVQRKLERDPHTRDLVLYLPDQLIVADHYGEATYRYDYDFVCRSDAPGAKSQAFETTGGYKRTGEKIALNDIAKTPAYCDHGAGEYADIVRTAKDYFRRGDLFEVVPGQVFHEPCKDSPSRIFTRLQERNKVPYGTLMNLGDGEHLLAASPEMYVRVQGSRVETCPISGTIARGKDAIEDAQQIKTLLNSKKDEAELSMCTDVDRNDKSRVCVPGSVRVIGRRQVELYSRLIHTVDHVEGQLAPQYDALDAFLSHTWAVTVTGAPKQSAIQFIEDNEKSPRLWYGGAIGCIGFNGDMNTGLTLRAARIKDGMAQVRVGATLLMDSDPDEEEAETRLKASAMLAAIRGEALPPVGGQSMAKTMKVSALKVLMVDHRDSFVHNLGSYFREQGVELVTLRSALARARLQRGEHFDLVILSPGPGKPEDFALSDTIALCTARHIPIFGVCLGLQGIVEAFGGALSVLEAPMHGKGSSIEHKGGVLFRGIPSPCDVGRYHSLYANGIPDCLKVTASTSDGVIMAIEHRELPIMAVQFHPESILSLRENSGQKLVANVVQYIQAIAQQRSHQAQELHDNANQYA